MGGNKNSEKIMQELGKQPSNVNSFMEDGEIKHGFKYLYKGSKCWCEYTTTLFNIPWHSLR